MMKATGITVVRIAESTWGTLEPKPGVFDFSHIDRVLSAMDKTGIKVILHLIVSVVAIQTQSYR